MLIGPDTAGQEFQMSFPPGDAVLFDPEAFDNLLRTHGVQLQHYRALPCPVGMIDPDDQRHPSEDHEGCSNGHIHVLSGDITCSFLGNSKDSILGDLGRMDGSTVQVTFPRYYDQANSNDALIPFRPCPLDRIYLKDETITVPHPQYFAANVVGVDRLNFPVVEVTDLVDNQGKRYAQGVDFTLWQGQIKWLTQNRPGLDPKTQKGRVCGIRYHYHPFWYVQRMIHEIRVSQVEDEFTGERKLIRFPQQAVLQREYVFLAEQKDQLAKNPNSLRQQHSPGSGQFGPR